MLCGVEERASLPSYKRCTKRDEILLLLQFVGNKIASDFRRGWHSKITSEISDYMEWQLEEDNETTSVELKRLIARKFGIDISSASICRHLRESLQWVVVRTRCGPMILDTNKQKQMEFARMRLENKDNFENMIWTVESSVQLKTLPNNASESGQGSTFKACSQTYIKSMGRYFKKSNKYPHFNQTMDAPLYVQILKGFLVPFIEKYFVDGRCHFIFKLIVSVVFPFLSVYMSTHW